MHAAPSATTCGFPLTGAARKPTPASSAMARTRAEAAEDTVEQSTIISGRDDPASSATTTSSRSREEDTVTNTMSHEPKSAIRSATRAPADTSGAVLTAVRFHTVTRSPASISRPASAAPIRPVPSQPRLRTFAVMPKLLTKETNQTVTPASTHRRQRPPPARTAAAPEQPSAVQIVSTIAAVDSPYRSNK